MNPIPGIVMLLLFNYLPMYGLVIAFKNFVPLQGIWGSEWNGMENFEFFFTSVDAVRTIRNTVLYSLMFIAVDVIFGLAVGIALYVMYKTEMDHHPARLNDWHGC